MKRFLSAAAAASALVPSLAFAQEAAEHGMPQLDFANPLTISQVVWLAIIFFALYLLLSRWALPQVASVIEARGSSIAEDLNAARRAKAQADAAVAEFTQATAKPHQR
jgi:F-type H+-transporting ATPase subunit b